MNTKRTREEVAAFRAAHNVPVSYNIVINEEQRAIIAAALSVAAHSGADVIASDSDELSLLLSMFVALPRSEVECPSAMHSFVA